MHIKMVHICTKHTILYTAHVEHGNSKVIMGVDRVSLRDGAVHVPRQTLAHTQGTHTLLLHASTPDKYNTHAKYDTLTSCNKVTQVQPSRTCFSASWMLIRWCGLN